MIDARADDRQAQRNVHPRIEGEHLERNMPLVVVHAHNGIVLTQLLADEDRVGRNRAFDGHAGGAGGLNRRRDGAGLLIAEQAVFARVGIESADHQPRCMMPQLPNRLSRQRDDLTDTLYAQCLGDLRQ